MVERRKKRRLPGNPNMVRGMPSVNPSGRSPVPVEVRDAARAHTTEAIATLVKNLNHPNGHVANSAAIALLDRGWGKPLQSLELHDKSPHITINYQPHDRIPDDRMKIIDRLEDLDADHV
jgi:hypothetical protein